MGYGCEEEAGGKGTDQKSRTRSAPAEKEGEAAAAAAEEEAADRISRTKSIPPSLSPHSDCRAQPSNLSLEAKPRPSPLTARRHPPGGLHGAAGSRSSRLYPHCRSSPTHLCCGWQTHHLLIPEPSFPHRPPQFLPPFLPNFRPPLAPLMTTCYLSLSLIPPSSAPLHCRSCLLPLPHLCTPAPAGPAR